jgi:large subunit ribosomal protein L30
VSKRKAAKKTLRVTLVRSAIGYSERQKATVRSLGLRKLGQVVEKPDSPVVRGLINKVSHLLQVEEVEG